MSKLVLIRHGQSEWNLSNQFTGWVDVNLSEKGVEEAKKAGRLIKEHGLEFDQAYTSLLTRAIKTLHYAVHIWRRSYDVLPPAIDDDNEYSQAHDRRYANLDPHIVPKAENLHVTLDRVMPFWEDHIAPDLLDGKNVIIAAHGNSLRALTKYIENISDDDIMDLEMKTGEPVVYTFDDKLDVVNKEKLDD